MYEPYFLKIFSKVFFKYVRELLFVLVQLIIFTYFIKFLKRPFSPSLSKQDFTGFNEARCCT